MRRCAPLRFFLSLACVWAVSVFVAAPGLAAPVELLIEGDLFAAGDPAPLPVSVSLVVESTQPDENPASNVYLATDHGAFTLDTVLAPSAPPINLIGTPSQITADAVAGAWGFDITIDLGLATVDADLEFLGLGLTPDQILPDFTSIQSGVLTADTGALGLGVLSGDVSLTIVPEPSTALLVGLGLTAFGLRRRRSRAR